MVLHIDYSINKPNIFAVFHGVSGCVMWIKHALGGNVGTDLAQQQSQHGCPLHTNSMFLDGCFAILVRRQLTVENFT